MVLYQCPRCGHNFSRKAYYLEHINRKNKCEPILKDVEPIETNFIKNSSRFICNDCNKTYSNQGNLKTHKCKQNPNINMIINTDNSIHIDNSTINNYIVVNDFKHTNFENISDEKKYQFLKTYNMAIPNALREANFNVKYPENHNIFLSNLKLKTVKYKEGDKWCYKHGKEIVEDIITEYHYKVFYKFCEREDIKQKYPNIEETFDKYMEITSNESAIEAMTESIYQVLYNNRDIVIKTNNL
jgi:hypothetical protein